ncbi:MAG: Lrp/AsnC family transcriptional regulator [Solirubrobacteraceae bacterium]
MSHGHPDDVDQAIIRLLTEDARRSIKDIAEHVNLSPAPVKRRIARLEADGVIRGYTTILDSARARTQMEAFTELRFAGDTDVDDIVAAISRTPEVKEAFTIAGDPDALVRVEVTDVRDLQRVIKELRRSGPVTGTKTLIVLERRTLLRGQD